MAAYLKLLEASGLGESVDRHMGIRRQTQGWTGSLMVTSLILLNLARGESVDDLRILDKDYSTKSMNSDITHLESLRSVSRITVSPGR